MVRAIDAISTKNALIDYRVGQGWLADRRAGDAWLLDRWYRVTVRGRTIPAVPLYGFKRPLILHDIHHLITGYPTDLCGEMALAGWELGSGGCAYYPVFWLVQLGFFVTALLLMPSVALRAFASGRTHRNLYRCDPDALLSQTIDATWTYVRRSCGWGRGRRTKPMTLTGKYKNRRNPIGSVNPRNVFDVGSKPPRAWFHALRW
jgi:hypothetical protein